MKEPTSMRYADAMARSTRVTTKYRNYAALYDLVLRDLPAAPTVVEIGIANGGSLETWRTLFGPEARIAGVDLNPATTALREEGFEIFILDTGAPASWDELARAFPNGIDLLVDDGGHTNRQQIASMLYGTPLVRDGGWVVIEDLHCSFMHDFGNPSPISAAAFIDELADDLHRAHPRSDQTARHPVLASMIDYIVSSKSWAALRVRRWDESDHEEHTEGTELGLMDYDHRWDSSSARKLAAKLPKPLVKLGRRSALKASTAADTLRLFRSDSPRR